MIILIVAAAVLVGWLLFQVARLTIGDVRFPRIHAGSLQGASGGAPSIPTQRGGPGESVAPAAEARREPEPSSDEERPLDDRPDVEQAVYERLYGQRGRRA